MLLVTARYFQGRRRWQRALDGIDLIPRWTTQSIEANKPLHLAFGNAAVGAADTPAALAEAEFFHHVIRRANASDMPPIVSTSAPATLPLSQDTLRRAWDKGDSLTRAQWYPPNLAYAGALTAELSHDEAAAHILAGSFGLELALMLESAQRHGQPSLAVSERLDGQAVAFAMADRALIGEELYAASGAIAEADGSHNDASVMDVWRAIIIVGATLLLMLEFSRQLPLLSWQMVAGLAAVVLALSLLSLRRR